MNKTALIVALMGEEGKRNFVYDDATGHAIGPGTHCVGHPTIGVGRALDVHGISMSEGQLLNAHDALAGRPTQSKTFQHAAYDLATGRLIVPGTDIQGGVAIGFGRVLNAVGITDAEIAVFLSSDIDTFYGMLMRALPWFSKSSDNVQQALTDLCFNMGLSKLMGFTNTLRMLENHNYAAAAEGLKNSLWAKQVQPSRVNNIVTLIEKG